MTAPSSGNYAVIRSPAGIVIVTTGKNRIYPVTPCEQRDFGRTTHADDTQSVPAATAAALPPPGSAAMTRW